MKRLKDTTVNFTGQTVRAGGILRATQEKQRAMMCLYQLKQLASKLLLATCLCVMAAFLVAGTSAKAVLVGTQLPTSTERPDGITANLELQIRVGYDHYVLFTDPDSPSGASYSFPQPGVITKFQVQEPHSLFEQAIPGSLPKAEFLVIRKTPANNLWNVVYQSGYHLSPYGNVSEVQASVPVQAGDRLAFRGEYSLPVAKGDSKILGKNPGSTSVGDWIDLNGTTFSAGAKLLINADYTPSGQEPPPPAPPTTLSDLKKSASCIRSPMKGAKKRKARAAAKKGKKRSSKCEAKSLLSWQQSQADKIEIRAHRLFGPRSGLKKKAQAASKTNDCKLASKKQRKRYRGRKGKKRLKKYGLQYCRASQVEASVSFDGQAGKNTYSLKASLKAQNGPKKLKKGSYRIEVASTSNPDSVLSTAVKVG